MIKFHHFALFVTGFVAIPSLFAAQPPDVGNFKGLAFSSATERHPLEIRGGNLVNCKNDTTSRFEINKCDVEGGSVVVTGGEWNRLDVKVTRAAVLRDGDTTNYYLSGAADLTIGGQLVAVLVKVTLTLEDDAPNRVRGFIDLPDQAARTSLEAYRAGDREE